MRSSLLRQLHRTGVAMVTTGVAMEATNIGDDRWKAQLAHKIVQTIATESERHIVLRTVTDIQEVTYTAASGKRQNVIVPEEQAER